ncbi:hypothetical protein SDC9_149618 [bioreactor metagenome]|uniref:Adenosylcobinamide amidohydrolase n=1 Tax=bioreactor metagenome TaxID=1076179 RepID=A0A645EMA0_9ZZZZ
MRKGPSPDVPVVWEYRRKDLPVKVVARHDIWRKIEDPDGTQGWMAARLLSRTRTAIVTGGVDINGGRAGDTALWHERNGEYVYIPGTINIILHISAALTPGAMTRALITCTEAKTAALQELLAPSCYSSGIATGSGTDGCIIVSDLTSPVKLTDAGKHNKLGELIGRAVIGAVKEALYLQTYLCAYTQFDVIARIGRYGVDTKGLPETLSRQPEFVVYTSLYVHLLDQLTWELITPEQALEPANALLALMGMQTALTHANIQTMLSAYQTGLKSKYIHAAL